MAQSLTCKQLNELCNLRVVRHTCLGSEVQRALEKEALAVCSFPRVLIWPGDQRAHKISWSGGEDLGDGFRKMEKFYVHHRQTLLLPAYELPLIEDSHPVRLGLAWLGLAWLGEVKRLSSLRYRKSERLLHKLGECVSVLKYCEAVIPNTCVSSVIR